MPFVENAMQLSSCFTLGDTGEAVFGFSRLVNAFCFWTQVMTDAALLKRQKKEIEELRSKLQVIYFLMCWCSDISIRLDSVYPLTSEFY